MSPLPFSSSRRPDPTAPWTNEEVAARLERVFEECESEYHFVPSPDDWTALRKACALIRAIHLVVEAADPDLDHLRDHGDEELRRAIDLVTHWPERI